MCVQCNIVLAINKVNYWDIQFILTHINILWHIHSI